MLALTAVAWVPCTLVACFGDQDRPRLFFFHLALAETAVLGAFMAQDLALFIVFFDLMLVPFYFLIGGWGTGDRVRATTKFVIYTLAGSLLMLAGAIALGVLATPARRAGVLLARGHPGARRGRGHAAVDLPALRARLPRQGAAVPAARLGARDLPLHPDRGARAALRRAVQGRRVRLPADRAADHARRGRSTSRSSCSCSRSSRSSTGPCSRSRRTTRGWWWPTRRSRSSASSCSGSSPWTTRAPRAPCSRCSTTGSW